MYFHLNKKKMIFEIFLMNPKIKPTRKTIFLSDKSSKEEEPRKA